MGVETWVAIFAALVAVAALFFNWQSTLAAKRAARAAEDQTELQQQLRIEAAQPYVWADIRPDDAVGTLINLVVGNSGPTVARNIRVVVEPPLPATEALKHRADVAETVLTGGIQSLAPGRTLMWPLGQGFNLIKEDGVTYTFTITADGPFGAVPPLSYTVDMSNWRAILDRPTGNLHQLTLAVKDLTKTIDKKTPPAVS